jgi:hypothetical protein
MPLPLRICHRSWEPTSTVGSQYGWRFAAPGPGNSPPVSLDVSRVESQVLGIFSAASLVMRTAANRHHQTHWHDHERRQRGRRCDDQRQKRVNRSLNPALPSTVRWCCAERLQCTLSDMPVGERGLLELEELSPQEQSLCGKAVEGGLLDLRSHQPGADDPSHGWDWDARRSIRAQVLFQLLTGCGPRLANSVVAVRVSGARIVGRLNLGGWELKCPLELCRCHLAHRLHLAKAVVPNLSLRQSYLRSRLSARGLKVVHTLNLTGFHCRGGVVLRDANIAGQLECAAAVFANPKGEALCADGLNVHGGMFLLGAQCLGEVRLTGGKIGSLVCDQTMFSKPQGSALNGDRLTVTGDMSLSKAQCVGRVSLGGANVGGSLNCDEATFNNPGDLSLSADRLIVNESMFLRRVSSSGQIQLTGAKLGSLVCHDATLRNPNGMALNAARLTTESDTYIVKAQCVGEVRLLGARIDGQLNCSKTIFSNPGGDALSADGLTVQAAMFLREARSDGEVRLLGARISGQLTCDSAVFSNPGRNTLSADGLTVNGHVFLTNVKSDGHLDLSYTNIAGALHGHKAVFTNRSGVALTGERLSVDGLVLLKQAECVGEIRLRFARIGGHLDCTDAVFSNPGGVALSLERASVGQSVRIHPTAFAGGLDVRYARVGAWHDDMHTWPHELQLEGFIYDAIDNQGATVKDRLRSWLPRDSYHPQPYEQLAAVLRRAGEEHAARRVAIGKQKARRHSRQGWPARSLSQAWSAVLRYTIGYGYRPALALIPLTALILGGSVLFQIASRDHRLLHAARSGSEQPQFNSFRYTMDLLLPVVNFRQRDAFVAGGWAAWASFGFTFAGWLFAAIVVAGLSGVFRRE